MNLTNNVIRFTDRPEGRPTADTFAFDSETVRPLRNNEFLVKNLYLSMDPALVGRMRKEDNYAESVEPGDVMHAYAIGQVIKSNNKKVKVGEVRFGRFDMQEYAISDDTKNTKAINLGLADPSWYLSLVGITGATAYFSLFDIGKPKRGETIVISAGASSVGSTVAQMAKKVGCRTVAIVSTEEKAKQVIADWGYDAAVCYRGKSTEDLEKQLALACPRGVDIYYDNTSGDISEALLDLYNENARIVVVGRLGISHLPDTKLDTGRRDNNVILSKRIKKQGFVLLDYQSKIMGAVIQIAKWIKQGDLKIKEDILHGIDKTPEAFFRMLDGKNDGKQLVKLADVNHQLDPSPRWLGAHLISKRFPTSALAMLISRTHTGI